MNFLYKCKTAEIFTSLRVWAVIFLLGALFPQCVVAQSCVSLFESRFLNRNPRVIVVSANGTLSGPAWNQPVSLLTEASYRQNPRLPIGRGSLPAFKMSASVGNRVLRGQYKSLQTHGNNPGQSWSTNSEIEIDLDTGQFWSQNLLWKDGWKRWTDVQCFGHGEGMIVRAKLRHFYVLMNLWLDPSSFTSRHR